jgi:hypothetical protein
MVIIYILCPAALQSILIGILSSLFSSDIPFGAIFQNLLGMGSGLEITLDTINFWLGFTAALFLTPQLHQQLPPSSVYILVLRDDL